MSIETAPRGAIMISLDQIEPNHWNTNEVKGDKYTQLVKDMQEQGQHESITVSPVSVFYDDPDASEISVEYVLCDGEHRYRAAKSLGWTEIKAVVEELTEDEAVTRFYRQQSTRGDNNPFREAELFEHYHEKGLKEPEIAEKFNVTRAYVSGRRMLLNATDTVRVLFIDPDEKLEELGAPGAKLTAGHVKAIIGLDPEDQDRLALRVLTDHLSVRAVEDEAKHIKETKARRKRFVEAHLNAVRKECPICGKHPVRFWDEEAEEFQCENTAHSWKYNITDEEQAELKAQAEQQRLEQQKQADYELIEHIITDYENNEIPLTLDTLQLNFWRDCEHQYRKDTDQIIQAYLEEHPETELAQPPEPEPTPEPEKPEETEEQRDERISKHLEKELGQALHMPPSEPEQQSVPRETKPETPRVLRFVTSEHSPEELREMMASWSIGKFQSLAAVESIKFTGYNADGDTVTLDYNPKYAEGKLRYTVENEEFDIFIPEHKHEGKTVISLNNTAIPWNELAEQKDRIMFFFQHLWNTDHEPWFIPTPEPVVSPEIEPVPDHGRDYQGEDPVPRGAEPSEEGLVLCAHCGKQVPATQYCMYCAELLLPAETQETEEQTEDIAHVLTANEKQWLESPVKDLRAQRDQLTEEETTYLLEKETRKSAQGLLSKHMESFTPPAESIEAEDD